MPTFEELPKELKLKIFSELDRRSLNNAYLLNRESRDIITKNLWTEQQRQALEQQHQAFLKQKYAEQTTDPASQDVVHTVHLHLVGDCGAGKTSLLIRYCEGDFPESTESVSGDGFNERQYSIDGHHIKPDHFDNENRLPKFGKGYATYMSMGFKKEIPTNSGTVDLSITNSALYEHLRQNQHNPALYIPHRNITLVFFDITNRKSFENLIGHIWVEKSFCENCFFIIVGTKRDLKKNRAVSEEEAKQFAKEQGFPYIETSALTGENVEETFKLAVEIVLTAKLNHISMSEAAGWVQNIRFEIKPDEPQPETNTTSKCLVM